MTSTVFARASQPVVEADFLSDFRIVKGSGSLDGLTDGQYVIINGMTYVQGYCAENKEIVGGYKRYDPDDGRNLRERGFVWNADLDVPTVEMRGRAPLK